jgi:hypothetical protein
VGFTSTCSLSKDEETMSCDEARTMAAGTSEKETLVYLRMSSRN